MVFSQTILGVIFICEWSAVELLLLRHVRENWKSWGFSSFKREDESPRGVLKWPGVEPEALHFEQAPRWSWEHSKQQGAKGCMHGRRSVSMADHWFSLSSSRSSLTWLWRKYFLSTFSLCIDSSDKTPSLLSLHLPQSPVIELGLWPPLAL